MKKMFAIILCLLMLTSTAHAETLRLYQVILQDDFQTEHPNVNIQTNYTNGGGFSYGTMELYNALLGGTFDWDVFETWTHETDIPLLMKKGYLLDLSSSKIIRDYIARLYPDVAAQCMYDGKIYAVPMGLWDLTPPKTVSPVKWQEVGYTEADVPQTYGEYLDFIDAWLNRREADPSLTLNVFSDFTPYEYGIHSYSAVLVDELLESHIAQLTYAGQPLSFSDPALPDLLEQAKAVGERIFRYEPTKTDSNSNFGLFGQLNQFQFSEQAQWQANLRIHEEQPLLTSHFLTMTCIYAGTENPELAIAALESSLLQYLSEEVHASRIAMMCADSQPVRSSSFDSQMRLIQNFIAMCEHRLAGDDTPYTEYVDMTDLDEYRSTVAYWAAELPGMMEADVRDRLARKLESAEWYRKYQEYTVSPDFLAAWRQYAQHLYFPGPNIFTADEGYENFTKLKRQFVDGLIDARQLVNELDRIAWMMEMENQ